MPTVSFRAPQIPRTSFRNEAGQFTSTGNSAQYAANRRLAEVLRADLGEEIEAHVAAGRYAGYSSGRLAKASAAPENATVELFRVGIGNPRWLDRSQAKYWRTFESGSAAVWKRPFIGTPLHPVKGKPLVTAIGTRAAFIRPGAYIVGKEIDPAGIYGQVAARENLTEHALQMARRYLSNVFRG